MKKTLLLFFLIAGVYRLNAQQLFPVKPADTSLSGPSINRYLIPRPAYNWNLLQPQVSQLPVAVGVTATALYKNAFSDHMPVIVLGGDSKMPVKKIGGYYTMPVIKIGGEDEQPIVKSIVPGWPASNKP